ncbi:glycoside hydrolase [Ophiobolus disseminans]|uniref:Glycoside hydrolase n=1 Tax=Ophiobolus disseminans TaxID=1469910 RepID=A0A6A7A9N7_9PLEO|nr:glycoside hydrolase [Ophiobolus disseminans]
MDDYPRPDFVRDHLVWQSLNGPWGFLFDDNDLGVSNTWYVRGLPNEVELRPTNTNRAGIGGEDIVAKIASGTQKLLEGNSFRRGEMLMNKKQVIRVPYVFQCPASGINDKGVHEVLWYERVIQDPRNAELKSTSNRVLLRFGAVDYEAKVWVGGHFFGGHRGGHVPFEVDITDAFLSGKIQRLTMRVFDSSHDLTQPRGKQYWKAVPESIFYTPSGGIWQDAWLESVPEKRIGDGSAGTVLRSNDIENGKLHASIKILGRPAGRMLSIELEVSLAGVAVGKTDKIELPHDSNTVDFDVSMRLSESQQDAVKSSNSDLAGSDCWHKGTALWSPEHPILYDLIIHLYAPEHPNPLDTVRTTTGMRSLTWTSTHSTFLLNNRPYFQALFLDQGYWPSTFLTPPSSTALKTDIELSKRMGFNGCRKHQKVEDPRFLYWADRLGFLVWGEMANAYAFSAEYVSRFDQEWREAVMRDINHPCVVAWTPVNESWAYTDLQGDVRQRNHIRSLYHATKTLDPTRPVNDNCGWEHVQTDLSTFHDYADGEALTQTCKSLDGILGEHGGRPLFLKAVGEDPGSRHRDGAPVICTEFGGVNIARNTGGKEGERDWGYTTATDSKDLLKRIEKMMTGIVDGGHICGFVYTQLTDIEQEVNGLYTPDRKEKLDAAEVKRIVEGVKEKYAAMHK